MLRGGNDVGVEAGDLDKDHLGRDLSMGSVAAGSRACLQQRDVFGPQSQQVLPTRHDFPGARQRVRPNRDRSRVLRNEAESTIRVFKCSLNQIHGR